MCFLLRFYEAIARDDEAIERMRTGASMCLLSFLVVCPTRTIRCVLSFWRLEKGRSRRRAIGYCSWVGATGQTLRSDPSLKTFLLSGRGSVIVPNIDTVRLIMRHKQPSSSELFVFGWPTTHVDYLCGSQREPENSTSRRCRQRMPFWVEIPKHLSAPDPGEQLGVGISVCPMRSRCIIQGTHEKHMKYLVGLCECYMERNERMNQFHGSRPSELPYLISWPGCLDL
uniref:Transmembrane protein n=1 Tax=Steinernema glaseri TaxID=37863 RepID=A0A1I7YBL1_9BILA